MKRKRKRMTQHMPEMRMKSWRNYHKNEGSIGLETVELTAR
jgi:hypothetical protein